MEVILMNNVANICDMNIMKKEMFCLKKVKLYSKKNNYINNLFR